MELLVENISEKAIRRLSKNALASKVSWIGIREKGETDVSFEDDRYAIYTGRLVDGRDYVEIRHQEMAFVIMSGDFNRVIVE